MIRHTLEILQQLYSRMRLKNPKSKGYVFTKALLTLCGMIFLLWKVGIFPLHYFAMVKISLIY